MKEFEQLEERLKLFGSKLSLELCKELRDILDSFAQLHYAFGEAYKMAVIDLIPSKIQTSQSKQVSLVEELTGTVLVKKDGVKRFEPPKKQSLADLTMTLAKNLDLQLKSQKKE